MTKKKKRACKKALDAIAAKLQKEFDSARIESVLYGVALLALDAEGGIRHIPMEAIQKGELFGGLQKNSI